jgi:hypothetical protein
VRVTDKIGDVKAKVQDQQRLLFNGQQLVDGQTLADYGIRNESTLQVFVKMFAGQTITLEVDPSNTIGDVKEMIGDHQSLTFDGNELVDDGKTLAEYNVIMGSTLHLDAWEFFWWILYYGRVQFPIWDSCALQCSGRNTVARFVF